MKTVLVLLLSNCEAVAGGLLARSVGFSGYRGASFTILVAIIGAVLLTLLGGGVERQKALRAATLSVA